MSDAKKSEKKSVKKKHSSSSSTKNKKNEDPNHVPSLPSDQKSQKLARPNSLDPHLSYRSEHKVRSPSKKPKPDSYSTHGSLPIHRKKVSPISSRDCSPPEVIIKRTSSGSHYYKLSHSSKKHIESPISDRSGSVPVIKRKADVQLGDEECSLKKKAICQKEETQTYKDEKEKKKKKKTKLIKKEVASKKQESATEELNKIQQKLGTFVNTFKIVTLPKESSSDISARAHAFEEYCQKRARLIKSKKAKSSLSQKIDPELKPLPSTTPNESVPCRENKEVLSESNAPSSAQKLETTSSSICFHDVEDLEEEMQIVEELVTARSEKKLDLAVAQTCGELTSMDIDSSEDDAHNLPVNKSCTSLIIVIDTNIMIGHLKFIKTLKTMEIPGLGKPILIIPWVVLQELDYMKNGKLLQSVKHKAIPAVDFIYICLKNQDPQ